LKQLGKQFEIDVQFRSTQRRIRSGDSSIFRLAWMVFWTSEKEPIRGQDTTSSNLMILIAV